MYSYISAIVLDRSPSAQYQPAELATTPLYVIFNSYREIYITVHHSSLPDDLYINLTLLRSELSSNASTLQDWLVAIGNRSLPVIAALPSTTLKYASYRNAIQAGYHLDLPKPGVNVPSYFPTNYQTTMAIMTRPRFETDMTLIDRYCLVSVNGFFHKTASDNATTYLYDAQSTLRKSRDNHVGIVSLKDIGELTKFSLTNDSIAPQGVGSPLKERTYITLPTDLTNKTTILVLGGYLVFPQENVFWQTSNNSFALNFGMIPLLERYFESRNYLDLSGLGLSIDPEAPDKIDPVELYSDRVLLNYLTMTQTFLVIVDSSVLFANRKYPSQSQIPSLYTTYQEPRYPLVLNFGRCAEYWSVRDGDRWSLSVQDTFLKHGVYGTTGGEPIVNLTDRLIPSSPFHISSPYFLEIGGYH